MNRYFEIGKLYRDMFSDNIIFVIDCKFKSLNGVAEQFNVKCLSEGKIIELLICPMYWEEVHDKI